MRIETLSHDVISQIAAGEVVERPSHMVKELVENSLDAYATEIEVHLQQGGRKLLIKDNGHGILKADLQKCLLLHTTSKIQNVNDLWNLHSFGFRGEALSSISSVSQVHITSKSKDSKEAYQIVSDFGKLSKVQISSHTQGTTLIVEELFQNVPARLKFLRSDHTELFHIKNALKAMALSHPEVQFKIKQNGKLLFYWPKEDTPSKRIETILEVKKIYHNKIQVGSTVAEVFVTAPNETTSTNRSIFLFAQKRWIQDRALMSALLDAHRGLLMHSEYPSACVFISLPDHDIDVNIHPTKSQVRLKNPSETFRAVRRTTREILEKTPWLESLNFQKELTPKTEEKNPESLSSYQKPFHATSYSQDIKEAVTNYATHTPIPTQTNFSSLKVQENFIKKPSSSSPHFSETSSLKSKSLQKWSHLQILGQAQLTYIITQNDHSLVLIDQHAAHERVLYETLLENYKNKKFEVQNFLIPLSFHKDSSFINAIESISKKLESLGLIVEREGLEVLNVKAACCLLSEKAILTCLEEIGHDILEKEDSFSLEKKIEHLMATMACHSAIRAGKSLAFEEVKSLLQKMDLYPLSCFCPHGRPVYIEHSFSQLEKEFKRKV